MHPRRIGFLVYPNIQALDLAGPVDAFTAAAIDGNGAGSRPGYEPITIGLSANMVRAESGLVFKPQFTIRSAPPVDTLVIPGGSGMRQSKTAAAVGAWIRGLARRPRRVAAVCTGVYGLAASGLLEGRRVTTHWRYARDLASRYPSLRVDEEALYLRDGPYYTSAGVTAGIDLSLALIEEDYGPSVALAAARDLVVYLKRPGGQGQYSEPLQYQVRAADRFADLVGWISANLRKDLSVPALAARARLGTRHFARRFNAAVGCPPAQFVETVRLDEARRRLAVPHRSIEDVATSVGFATDDVFRRAFERRFRISPSIYRSRFSIGDPRIPLPGFPTDTHPKRTVL
jgi:transcriptional regulator GlxA family with amidase domain